MTAARRGTRIAVLSLTLALLAGCGGGGGSSPPPPPPPPAPLTITTAQNLPAAVQGLAYSATLTASGGSGSLHWTIAPQPPAQFPTGLAIDAATGVLSGTPDFGMAAVFVAVVTDATQAASKTFYINEYSRLTVSDLTNSLIQYGTAWLSLPIQGGVPSLTYSVTSGSLPPGVSLDPSYPRLAGTATVAGSFQSTVTVKDAYNPPQTATMQVNLTVTPPRLSAVNSIPARLVSNQAFAGRLVANGGTPPYTFAINSGSLPPGLTLSDATTGAISGTPTAAGSYSFRFTVTDSSSPQQSAWMNVNTTVAAPLGRNDSVQTATPLSSSTLYASASISPYEDPPATATAGDQDYYKVTAVGGQVLQVSTWAKRNDVNNPLDTVLEIVDANGQRLNACNQPSDTAGNFTSACLNDDLSASPHIQDSALSLKLPGASTATPVYIHVLDWRGDARPDMTYSLNLSGQLTLLADPGPINGTSFYYARGQAITSRKLQEQGGVPPYAWSVTAGSLPPGLDLSTSGTLSGTPTTDGTYSSTWTVTDSLVPPQSASMATTILVEDPPTITNTSLPDGYTGTPYLAPLTVTGGTPPYWYVSSLGYVLIQNSAPTLSMTPQTPGTFDVAITVTDTHSINSTVHLPLVIHPGPLTVQPVNMTWRLPFSYSLQIQASGGTPPFTCSLVSGSLAGAATLNNCWLGSVASPVAGTYSATVQVTDSPSDPCHGQGS